MIDRIFMLAVDFSVSASSLISIKLVPDIKSATTFVLDVCNNCILNINCGDYNIWFNTRKKLCNQIVINMSCNKY